METFEEIYKRIEDSNKKLVDYLHRAIDIAGDRLESGLDDYSTRVMFQEALLAVLTDLDLTEITISNESMNRTDELYTGKGVKIDRIVHEDGSRTFKVQPIEMEKDESS
jgi:hypothetical protein